MTRWLPAFACWQAQGRPCVVQATGPRLSEGRVTRPVHDMRAGLVCRIRCSAQGRHGPRSKSCGVGTLKSSAFAEERT